MTKEELEKEAEEYAEGMAKYYASTHEDCIPSQFEKYLRNAYIYSSEPREKQIKIDAEQIRALQKQNGELTDKVKKLEAEVKEWKDKADLWCKTANLKDHNIMINKELQKENADLKEEINKIAFARGNLEEENAELKEKVNILDNCDRLGDVITEAYKDQLTKAKELLERFLGLGNLWDLDCKDYFPLRKEVEQFLKEVEK